MTLTYIKWRDASHSIDEWPIDRIELIELEEIGYLLRETEEAVTLSIEAPDGSDSTRLWLCIPKVNIVERRDWELEDLMKMRKRRRRNA